METSHQHAHHDHEQRHGQAQPGSAARHEEWNDEDFVTGWLNHQKEQDVERRRQFVVLRAFIPKGPDQEFRYLNLGAGPGNLDKVLLQHFPGANAVVLDGSLAMLSAARQELTQFGDRVEYVQANLAQSDWTGAVAGPFNLIVSTISIHQLSDPRRIRELYREAFQLIDHGGTFLNLDYVRPARAELAPLAGWIAKDTEAGFSPGDGSADMPGTMLEQMSWLSEAGFGCVDVFWKEMDLALIGAIRDHLHMP